MNLLVKDITELNPNTEFRSDVQMGSYRSDLNYELAKSYMFTTGEFPGKKASVDLLDILIRAALDRVENRILVQATYGHGKSHFGVALANFFGKANGSPESEILLENIGHTLNNPSRLEHFRSFKKYQKPRLVVILRGDTPGNLRDKFFFGLEEALREHEALREVRTPFWFEEALRFVSELEGDRLARAEAFLKPYGIDARQLRKELEERRSEHYQLCIDLFRQVLGFLPNFGGETSLTEAIDWALQELCADDKPFGGLLILFDEFSVFVGGYATRHPTGVPFQELMNGVDKHRGKVLFVAFAQHEPERLAKDDGSVGSQSLIKELNRLPIQSRYQLHSSLENVLRAYFKPNEASWRRFMQLPQVASKVGEASDVAYGAYEARYRRLNWTTEEFQERVAKSCYPLHPLTTVLLSSLELEAAATTRSVLGFLKDEEGALKLQLEQPAATDSGPNWVFPIRLVDYFEEMLGEKAWEQYLNVRVPDLTAIQQDVLKGMVLQITGKIETRKFGPKGYPLLIAQLSGYTPDEVAETLQVLEEQRYIRYDAANRIYAFWAGSNAALELERMLNDEIANRERLDRMGMFLDELDQRGSTKVNDLLSDVGSRIRKTYPVSVDWGNQDDWLAQEIVLTRKSFTPQALVQLTGRYHASIDKYPDCRGLVIIPIATSQDDVYWYRDNVETALDKNAHLKSAPLLVLRPNTPTPDLPKLLIRYALLCDGIFSDKAIREIGRQVYEEEQERYVKQINRLFQQLRSESEAIASLDARGRVNAVAASTKAADRIERLLKEVFAITYAKGLGTFFTQYRHTAGGTKMRDAVSNLVPILAANNLANARAGLADIAKDIVDRFIERDWGMLSRQSQLQPPASPRAQIGWNFLDAAFPAGETAPMGKVFDALLNLPYGYDYNTLTLLFACWYGYNRRDVELTLNQRLIALNGDFLSSGKKGARLKPSEVIESVGKATLRRRDRTKVVREVQEVINRVEKGNLKQEDAENAVTRLREFIKISNHDEALGADAETALKKINVGLNLVLSYDQKVKSIQEALERSSDITDIAKLLKQIADLTEPITVKSSSPSPDELRTLLMIRLAERTTALCTKYASLTKITDYGAHESQLDNIHRELNRVGLSELSVKVEEAKAQLLQTKQQLEAKQHEEHELTLINTFSVGASLNELIQSRGALEKLMQQGSEKVQAQARTKLEVIAAEIKRLQAFVVTLPQRLDAVHDLASARSVMQAILVKRGRYQNHADLRDIERDQVRCEQLEQFFQILQPSKNPSSPIEAEARVQELRNLPTKFDDHLSEIQRKITEDTLQNLQRYISRQEAEAASWLESMVGKLAGNHDLNQLDGELNRPHPFLAERHRQELRGLKQQLTERLNAELEEGRTLRAIKQIPEAGSLAQLQEALGGLTAYSSSMPSIQRTVQEKRGKIAAAIDELQGQLSVWRQRLEQIRDISQATKLHEMILKQVERYSGSELQSDAETLLAKAEVTAECWRADQVRRQQVERMPMPSTLVQLQKQRQELKEIEGQALSDALHQALKTHRENLVAHEQKRLAALDEQVEHLRKVKSNSDARKVQAELAKLETFFAGSELEARVKTVIKRSENIERYFASLRHYTDVNLEAPPNVPQHVESIGKIVETFGSYLDAAHKQLAQEMIGAIKQQEAFKRKEARDWLDRHKAEFDKASLEQLELLEQRLRTPHPFLLEADATELKALAVAVRHKIDENEVHSVLARFKKIQDPEKRLACLQQLQSLMQEQLV